MSIPNTAGRLRDFAATKLAQHHGLYHMCEEAAQEIERLWETIRDLCEAAGVNKSADILLRHGWVALGETSPQIPITRFRVKPYDALQSPTPDSGPVHVSNHSAHVVEVIVWRVKNDEHI